MGFFVNQGDGSAGAGISAGFSGVMDKYSTRDVGGNAGV